MISVIHGVEYHVLIDPSFTEYFDIAAEYIKKFKRYMSFVDGVIIIASSKQTDKRLENSNYYQDKKDIWFTNLNFNSKIKIDNIDLDLNKEEKESLDFVLEKFGQNVSNHGWYDVTRLS